MSQRSWKHSGCTLEVQLSKRVEKKTKAENLIWNVSELKDVHWNITMEKVVSLGEMQLLINEGHFCGSVEN